MRAVRAAADYALAAIRAEAGPAVGAATDAGQCRASQLAAEWAARGRRELAEAAGVRSIGRFEAPLVCIGGEGAGGKVLSGRLRLPGGGEVRVALKAAPLTSSGAVRMEREARVLIGVPHHPHVCHPLVHFEEPAAPVIAHVPADMQALLRDQTLSFIVIPRLERTMHGLLAIPVQGPKAPSSAGAGWRAPAWLTPDVMLGLWLQLLSAMAHLEHHGVAHCDLHLGNIMVSSDGTLRVIDFGCSSRRGADGNWLVRVGIREWAPGKTCTLAPEVREAGAADARILEIPLRGQPAWEAAQAMFCMSTGRAWADAEAVRLLSQGEWRVEGDVLSAMGAAAQRVLAAMLHESPALRMSASQGLAALVEAAGGWDRAGDLVLDTRAACRVALGLESATTAAAAPNLRAALASSSALAESESARRVRQVLESQLHNSSQLVVRNLLGKGCNGMVLQCDVDVPGRAWLVSPRGAPLSFVVKVLYPMGMESRAATRQVGEEFSLVSALSHPNVIRVHRHLHGEAPDSIIQLLDPVLHQFAFDRDTAGRIIRKRTMQFVVMDRHAETLQAAWQRFTQAGRVPVAFADVQLMLMAWQVVSAFAYLDSKAIEHRDIKLDNLLVAEDGVTVIVADFDLGVRRDADGTFRLHSGTAAHGNLPHTPPDVLTSLRRQEAERVPVIVLDMTKQSVWSVGVLLWEMLTGAHPFSGYPAAHTRLVESRLYEATSVAGCQPQRQLRDGFPAAMRDALVRMLDNDPARRPTMMEVHQVFERELRPLTEAALQAPPAPLASPFAVAAAAAGLLGGAAAAPAAAYLPGAPQPYAGAAGPFAGAGAPGQAPPPQAWAAAQQHGVAAWPPQPPK